MLFPKTFISASEKIDVGLEKQAVNFYFNFTQRRVVRYSCFDFFSCANWRYFQLSGLLNTYLSYQIRCTATYVHVEIHKILNFPGICCGDWNICAEYDLRGRQPLTVGINPYGDKKTYTSQNDFYGSITKLLYDFAQLRASNICKSGISNPCWHMLSQLQNHSWCKENLPVCWHLDVS